jgi:hydrogenase expression/formation protein HypE
VIRELIRLEHGSGGALSRELVEQIIHPALRNDDYPELLDATTVAIEGRVALTTDTYVVDPPFFPGADIGRLAVFGTCNDLAVSGAEPRFLTVGLVLEEGFPVADLKRALSSLAAAAREAGVSVVSGDTKVVPVGKGGGIYVNTTGLGARRATQALSPHAPRPGDVVIVSNAIGSHGIAVLAARERLSVGANIRSDCANLWPLCRDLLELGDELRFMRDATRGGVAAVLNETAAGGAFGILVRERDIPVAAEVRTVAEILGLDPLVVANEGVLVAVVSRASAEPALRSLRAHAAGAAAAAVGVVTDERPGRVVLETSIGGRRILDFPRGLLLPRIC